MRLYGLESPESSGGRLDSIGTSRQRHLHQKCPMVASDHAIANPRSPKVVAPGQNPSTMHAPTGSSQSIRYLEWMLFGSLGTTPAIPPSIAAANRPIQGMGFAVKRCEPVTKMRARLTTPPTPQSTSRLLVISPPAISGTVQAQAGAAAFLARMQCHRRYRRWPTPPD